MTWEIVVGIITLVGGVTTIAKVVSNNTKALTELKCGISELNHKTDGQGSELGKVSEKVENHEIRITKLEVNQ